MRHLRSFIVVTALALLLASSLASAQEPPSLRAAPPREPDVLRAAPAPAAVAQESRDIAGRWLGASDAAIQEFGKAGGSLTNIVTGKFSGLSSTIAIADWSAPLGAAWGGDVRGAVSSAVAIKVGGTVTSSGAALFGEIGAVTGGAVGSFFPVIGNIAGTTVGGAVGTAAGGFICAFGYDKYVKDYVAKSVLAGIAAVVDPLPMAEMRVKMDALMLQAMSPEQRALLEASSTFGGGEVQLLDFGTQPSVPTLKQPGPDAQQQAALPPGGLLPPMTRFEISFDSRIAVDDCRLDGDQVSCVRRWQSLPLGVISNRAVITGRLSGITMTGTETIQITTRYSGSGCTGTEIATAPVTYTFDASGTVKIWSGPYRATHSGCGSGSTWPSGEATLQWRVLQ